MCLAYCVTYVPGLYRGEGPAGVPATTGRPVAEMGSGVIVWRWSCLASSHPMIDQFGRFLPKESRVVFKLSSKGLLSGPSKRTIKGTIKADILGHPNPKRICTSHVERKNGSFRQWCKRFTRLTYAFSKKRENLRAACALHFAYYNFCRIHGSLRVTPAMEAEITDHVWDLRELIAA